MTSAKAYLQLLRLPNVVTAIADILAGYLFVGGVLTGEGASAGVTRLAILAGASACLYMAGVVLNDFFDFEQDAQERPQRPLPSGQIARRHAGWLGMTLLIAGVGLAQFVPGVTRLLAVMLGACILLYDGVLKRTPAGPPCMGMCRALNLLLGMSAAGGTFGSSGFYAAAIVGLYVTSLTGFARHEATGGSRLQLRLAGAGMLVALLGVGGLYWLDDRTPGVVFIVAGLLASKLLSPIRAAVRRPGPHTVQSVVKQGILLLVFVDAGLVFAVREVELALLVAALWLPSWLVGRFIRMT